MDSENLSTDQKYIFEMHHAIVSGDCSHDLAHRNPGKMAHSRWVTTPNSLLRSMSQQKIQPKKLLALYLI